MINNFFIRLIFWPTRTQMKKSTLLVKALIAYLALLSGIFAEQARNTDEVQVLGVDLDPNNPLCFPIEILNYHEIVNNVNIMGHTYSVTYSPLTGSNILLNTSTLLGDKVLGHSGRVYQNNLVMYDHGTKSFWSQIMREAIKGTLIKSALPSLPMVLTKYGTWKALYNNTLVLRRETGFKYNYNVNPYPGYSDKDSSRIMFPGCYSTHKDVEPYKSHKAKEWTFVVQTESDGSYALLPYSELANQSRYTIIRLDRDRKYPFFVFFDEQKQFTRAWSASYGGANHTFSTNDVPVPPSLSYDMMTLRDETDTVWNMRGVAISGPNKGQRLRPVNSFTAYWFAAISFFPTARVLRQGTLMESVPSVTCPPPTNYTAGSINHDESNNFCDVPCNMLTVSGAQDEVSPLITPGWMKAEDFENISRLPPNVTQFFVTWAVVIAVFLAVLIYHFVMKHRAKTNQPGMNKNGGLVTIDEGEEMMNEIELTGFNDEDKPHKRE